MCNKSERKNNAKLRSEIVKMIFCNYQVMKYLLNFKNLK